MSGRRWDKYEPARYGGYAEVVGGQTDMSGQAEMPHTVWSERHTGGELARDANEVIRAMTDQLRALQAFAGPAIASPLLESLNDLSNVVYAATARCIQADAVMAERNAALEKMQTVATNAEHWREQALKDMNAVAEAREVATGAVEGERQALALVEAIREQLRAEQKAGHILPGDAARIYRAAKRRVT